MRNFNNFQEVEEELLYNLISYPDFETEETNENINYCFSVDNPLDNKNDRSNYEYASAFFDWMISGDTALSSKIKELNPFASKFVDSTGLPESYSSSYGWKIKQQLPTVMEEILNNKDSRRGYVNILLNEDKVILKNDTTHEFPCTIGVQLLIRDKKLHMVVNMRSNNAFSVLPYDFYNMSSLLNFICEKLRFPIGKIHWSCNSMHVFRRDINKIKSVLD